MRSITQRPKLAIAAPSARICAERDRGDGPARGGGALETVVEGVTGCFWSGGWRELAQVVGEFYEGKRREMGDWQQEAMIVEQEEVEVKPT